MTTDMALHATLEERALASGGHSHDAIYLAVERCLPAAGGRLVDVGRGGGALWSRLASRFDEYIGVDGICYEGFPAHGQLIRADLDRGIPMADAQGDAVVSVETIEHLENPRAFLRELARIARPGAPVIVTTPNQLSALSLVTLVTRQRFASFQDVHYPAYWTALLEIDLRRIATEVGLLDAIVSCTLAGRIVFTARHYPGWLARLAPRLCSDTVVLIGRRAFA